MLMTLRESAILGLLAESGNNNANLKIILREHLIPVADVLLGGESSSPEVNRVANHFLEKHGKPVKKTNIEVSHEQN